MATANADRPRDDSSISEIQLDPAIMEAEGWSPGTVVRASSSRGRHLYLRLGLPDASDGGWSNIRLNRFMRQSLRVRLNDRVELIPAHPGCVRKVILQPAVDVGHAHNLEHHLHRVLVEKKALLHKGMTFYANFPDSVAGLSFKVADLEEAPGFVDENTIVKLSFDESHTPEQMEVSYEDVGGLDRELRLVRELVQVPLQFPGLYSQMGIVPPRGVILYGPPGGGKTHLARAIASEVSARFYYINGPDIIGTMYGETEGNLRRMFAEATHHAPSIILIDELDAIAPKRGETGAHSDVRMVTQLLSLMDGLNRVDGLIVMGTTNRIDNIDTALRRPGRFDREIFIGPPAANGRLDILQIHTREMPLTNEALDLLPIWADRTHGFVGADLMELCREAGLNALRRSVLELDDVRAAIRIEHQEMIVRPGDFEDALGRIQPSAMREAMVAVPELTWDDIGGLHGVKRRLEELIQRPLANPDLFRARGLRPPTGILLHGPSGTGKTILAQAAANACKVNFLTLNGPEVFSKWLGESEEGVRHLFRVARQLAPALIFIDQLDALAPRRGTESGSRTTERVVNQLLVELDSLQSQSNIIVMAATNRLDLIDDSVLRPGRLGVHLLVPLPDLRERAEVAQVHLRPARVTEGIGEQLAGWLAAETDGNTAAEVAEVCREARLLAMQACEFHDEAPMTQQHLERALAFRRGDGGT